MTCSNQFITHAADVLFVVKLFCVVWFWYCLLLQRFVTLTVKKENYCLYFCLIVYKQNGLILSPSRKWLLMWDQCCNCIRWISPNAIVFGRKEFYKGRDNGSLKEAIPDENLWVWLISLLSVLQVMCIVKKSVKSYSTLKFLPRRSVCWLSTLTLRVRISLKSRYSIFQ